MSQVWRTFGAQISLAFATPLQAWLLNFGPSGLRHVQYKLSEWTPVFGGALFSSQIRSLPLFPVVSAMVIRAAKL
jgi:hypothetical protein